MKYEIYMKKIKIVIIKNVINKSLVFYRIKKYRKI